MAAIKDVARLAGVSTASVSRVMTNHPSVSEEMARKVRAAAEALDFRPNAVGRSLRRTGTNTIGLVVSDILNPFFTELARAVEDAARAAGFSMILGNADEDPEQQDHYVEILLGRQVDGLIVVPTTETSTLLHEAARLNRTLVLVDRPVEDVDAPLVHTNVGPALVALVDHLVATGRSDMAMLAGPEQAGTSRLRLDTFRAALASHGLALPEHRVLHGDFREKSGRELMTRLLDSHDIPDALVFANAPMAIGALEACATYPSSTPLVPHDLALAAIDDLPSFRLLKPSITAIAQPTTELGHRAVAMLFARMRGEDVASEHLDSTLILRNSTDPRRTT